MVSTTKVRRVAILARILEAPNLAALWVLSLEARELSRSEGLRRLNAAQHTNVGLSRLGEWIKGARAPSPAVAGYMIADALPTVLFGLGMARREIERCLPGLARALGG
jgi:hypothetical protein